RPAEARRRRRGMRAARRLRALARSRQRDHHGPSRVRSERAAIAAGLRLPRARRGRLLARRHAAAALASAAVGGLVALSEDAARLDDDREGVAAVSSQASVVYVLPDKMGGMMNIVANLLEYRQPDGMSHHAVLTHNHLSADVRFTQPLTCDSQTTVEYTL